MRRTVIGLVGFVIVFVTLFGAKAEESSAKVSPLQIAIWNPVQLVPDDWDVWGLRLNLPYGCNRHVVGVDLGLVNFADALDGVQLGLFNVMSPYSAGFVVDALNGVQLGIFNLSTGMKGIQVGVMNGCASDSAGVQIAGNFNRAQSFTGLQVALLFNRSEDMKGVQIGLVNIADKMSGVQIGLANIIKESPVPFFPIINAHF